MTTRSFLAAVANDPASDPTPSLEELADLAMDVDCHICPHYEENEGRAVLYATRGQSEVWAKLYALCMAAGDDPVTPWPMSTVDAWIRLRRMLEALPTIRPEEHARQAPNGIMIPTKIEELLEDAFRRPDTSRIEAEGGPVQQYVVSASLGLVVYAMHRATLTGAECLAEAEALDTVFRSVMWIAENKPDTDTSDMTFADHFTHIDRARARAEEDHRESRPDPFEALSDWTLEAPKKEARE